MEEYDACREMALRIQPSIQFPKIGDLQRGGIIGKADIIDCVSYSASPWFVGRCGFVLVNQRRTEFQPCRGMLGFFKPDVLEERTLL